MYSMLIASSILPVVYGTLHTALRNEIFIRTNGELHIDHEERPRADGADWLRGCQKPVHFHDRRFLVDRAQLIGGNVQATVDVTNAINDLIVRDGLCNIAGGRRLQELPPEFAAHEGEQLVLSRGPHHKEFGMVSGGTLNFDAHELFDDVRGATDVIALNGQYTKLDQPLLVHYAEFRSADDMNKPVDVRDEINRLVAFNGLHDFTGNASLVSLFGDKALGQGTLLYLARGSRYLALRPGQEGSVYDLRPLFEESLYVEEARYGSIKNPEMSINITAEVNQLLSRRGVNNITRGKLLDMLEDPAPGHAKVLQVSRGGRMMDIKVPASGGQRDQVYDLMPMFLASGAIRAQRTTSDHQPSIFVAVMSRRSSILQRKYVRDMWNRAVGNSRSVTVRFGICRADDVYKNGLFLEDRLHGDLMFLDCEEGYGRGMLTKKLLAAMRAYRYTYPRDFFYKVDDDSFVAWRQFAELLVTRGHSLAYMGIPIGEGRPCRDPDHLWYEPLETFSNDTFPEAMSGGSGYVLGQKLVTRILDTGIAESNVLWNEDRAMGVWVKLLQQVDYTMAEYITVPGIDGWWGWDVEHPTKNWEYWADYPHVVHHGLQGETISCLAQAEAALDPFRRISHCFGAEVGITHEQLTCLDNSGSDGDTAPTAQLYYHS